MSATDKLRRMLDERGVEWETNETLTDCWTRWNVGNLRCTATEINGIFAFTVGNCTPGKAIAATLGSEVNGDTSDGYHTFNELYYHRTALFACLVALQPRQMAFKSWKHSDGTMYEDMFIAGIYTSRGWCTYHCEAKWWPLFDCHEQEFAPEWDGHTPSDAIHRLMSDFLPKQEGCGEVDE